jgi:membrane peptidoglycan carboxypeptidase
LSGSGTRRNPPSGGGRRAASKSAASGNKGKKGKKPTARRATKRGWRDWHTALKRLMITGIVVVVVFSGIFVLAYMNTTIPDPNAAYQAQTSYVYYSNGKAKVGSFALQNRDSVPLGEISQAMQDAAVAAEDHTFWTNKGIDPKGILRAAFSNAQGNATQGGSTITQKYVKLLYLTQQRTLSRKVKEVFLSLKLQRQESKQQILNGYLNTVYFGHGSYGVQAAALTYFGEDAKQLTASQAAMLAAIINSPNYYDPYGSAAQRQALLARYQYVVDGMVKMQTLDSATGSRIRGALPKVIKQRATNAYGGQRGFMLTMVKKQLLSLGFNEQQIDSGGLRVTTSFNRGVMAADQRAFENVAPKGVNKLHVGIASVNVKTGALMGLWGGQDYLKSQLNYATLASTSVGSSFKPFALAAGLEQGYNLKSTFDGNSPYVFQDGTTVHNEGEASGQVNGTSYGRNINLIYALQQSVNTAFVDLTVSMNDGPAAIRKTAIAMGVPKTDQIQANSRIALGQSPISPVDMANAYATIANRGMEHSWYVVSKVTDPSGKVLWEHHADQKRAIPEGVADDVSYAMQQVVKGGTGSYVGSHLGRPAAGKTGTATNDPGQVISSWFVGFTPQVSTAVMYFRGRGYDSLEGYLVPFYGATYPAQTWTAAMQQIMAGYPVETFPPAANVKGTPPQSGHAYTPPPPPPKKTKKAQPTKSAQPSKAPSPSTKPTPKPSPSTHPSAPPSPNCTVATPPIC